MCLYWCCLFPKAESVSVPACRGTAPSYRTFLYSNFLLHDREYERKRTGGQLRSKSFILQRLVLHWLAIASRAEKSPQLVLYVIYTTYSFFKDKKLKGRNCGVVSRSTKTPLDVLKDSRDMSQYWALAAWLQCITAILKFQPALMMTFILNEAVKDIDMAILMWVIY